MEHSDKTPLVTAQMLIRKSVSIVYGAFINPEITRNFWFTRASGILEQGKTITWEWEMYQVSSTVHVQELVPDKKIVFSWDQYKTLVEIEFMAFSADTTYVTIKQQGFAQTGAGLLKQVNEASGGFTTVLDGLKAYLEHGINLNLIADKFPREK